MYGEKYRERKEEREVDKGKESGVIRWLTSSRDGKVFFNVPSWQKQRRKGRSEEEVQPLGGRKDNIAIETVLVHA